jgi:ABC-2 type transport system ATP-binding protein
LGPNGAGKTTLVETLEGLRTPTAGRVSVLGLDPTKHARALYHRLGVQLQDTALPQDLTPLETLRLFGAFFHRSLAPEEVLERLGLADKARSRNRVLSGGQQRRLAIALALINDPELILLDEPTSSLDPGARRALLASISGLREMGRTVILTTHSLEEAEQLCDRVIILKRGEVVADGSPFELTTRSAGISTIWLAVEGDFDPGPLLRAGATDEGRDGEYFRFKTPAPTAAILALGDCLGGPDTKILDVRMKRPGLEAFYLELVGEGEGERTVGRG